jgi:hypothetical protein
MQTVTTIGFDIAKSVFQVLAPSNVRVRGQSGKNVLVASISPFDP